MAIRKDISELIVSFVKIIFLIKFIIIVLSNDREGKMLKILVIVPCKDEVKKTLIDKFGNSCEFIFRYSEDTEDIIKDVDVIIGEPTIEQVRNAEKLKWIQMTWAGADDYTRNGELPKGVTLTNASGAFGKMISEYVIGAILTQYRRFPEYLENQKKHIWQDVGIERSLVNKNILILGTGDLGRNVAKRLKSFDTVNFGIKRTVNKPLEYFDALYTLNDIDELLPKMDIVIGCLPNTGNTQGIFDYKRLNLMKKGGMLVNVGRGSLIIIDDLIKILKAKHLSNVVLDVVETEPLPQNSPLWDFPNVFVTPHISGCSFGHEPEAEKAIWKICINNLEKYISGEKLDNVVNIGLGY